MTLKYFISSMWLTLIATNLNIQSQGYAQLSKKEILRKNNQLWTSLQGQEYKKSDTFPSLNLLFDNNIPFEIDELVKSISNRESHFIKPLLLSGPTGIGKTSTAYRIAQETNCKIARTLACYEKKNGQSNLEFFKEIWELIQKRSNKKPYILCIENLDSMLNGKANQELDKSVPLLKKLLSQNGNKRTFLIAITNYPQNIAPEFKKNFSIIQFNLPSYRARQNIIKYNLEKEELSSKIRSEFIEDLAKATQGFAGRDFQDIFNNASLYLKYNIINKNMYWYTFAWNNSTVNTSNYGVNEEESSKLDKILKYVTGTPGSIIKMYKYYNSTPEERATYYAYLDQHKQIKDRIEKQDGISDSD